MSHRGPSLFMWRAAVCLWFTRSVLPPGAKLSAHVEVFKLDPATGKQVLVKTTRPCVVCGQPTDGGAVVPVGNERQVHLSCAQRS